VWSALGRLAYRDPDHIAERLALYGARNLGEPSLEWAKGVHAARPDVPRAVIAEELRTQTAKLARIDGAVSGTPFLIALVPGYLTYLWGEGRMVLRTASLYGQDPRELETTAAVLALRGVHPTVDAARAELEKVLAVPMPEKPDRRRSLRTWVRSVYVLLIFGGFLSAPSDARDEGRHPWLKASVGFVFGAVVWATTWVLPVTFMVAMAWGCESHARDLGRRALLFYDGDADSAQAARARRAVARHCRLRHCQPALAAYRQAGAAHGCRARLSRFRGRGSAPETRASPSHRWCAMVRSACGPVQSRSVWRRPPDSQDPRQ
jgi:hypothetical protein